MATQLCLILIVLPFIFAAGCYFLRSARIRNLIILGNGAALIAAAAALVFVAPFSLATGQWLGLGVQEIARIADFLLLALIVYLGYRCRSRLVIVFSVIQIVLLAYLDFFLPDHGGSPAIVVDALALIMVMIISGVGAMITFQAIPYMQTHERRRHPEKTTQHRFFAVMLLFLGAMNGMVLANDLRLGYFFFELTTLCSFLLIAHDKTPIAVKNAVAALWMNSLGGLAFILGLVLIARTSGSTLLHSSTMVKIGVYLLLRMAPCIRGTLLSQSIAVFGAFSFLAAAGLAIGQSNGKKVLAYSTISNLGLIFCCTGLNLPGAITAAIVLILFHAITKALLFLCVGTIEQHIDSRDIEDMRGVYARMPLTALITVMGIITMIMPPFGLLLGKWMAMEAAANNLFTIFMIALGSALTTLYWARWAGTLMSDPFAGKFRPERQAILSWIALGSLAAGSFLLSVASPYLYRKLLITVVAANLTPVYTAHSGIMESASDAFAVIPLSLVVGFGFFFSILAVRRAMGARIVPPYLSGAQTPEKGMFLGPMNQPARAEARNYYLSALFGEEKLTAWVNLAAGVLLTLILGGTL